MRVLVIDNYDSFTYNLVQYLGQLGPPTPDIEVVRNDRATVDELLVRGYERVIVSPGPCTPNEAGISLEAVARFPRAKVPTLGVCLGHQALVQAFGGTVIRHQPVHGKSSLMAVRHRELPVEGVQFHPESILTEQGRELLDNFLSR
jgi:anthranilate synthase/aminodeoxychorismate synthase-like glutamine amidotransferase